MIETILGRNIELDANNIDNNDDPDQEYDFEPVVKRASESVATPASR